MSDKDSAPARLTASAIDENVSDIAKEVAELVLDVAFDEKTFAKIPFLSLLVSAYGLGRNLRDRFFIKKIALFLYEAGRASEEKRTEFRKRLANEPEFQTRCGERVLQLLDKVTESAKARLMGFAFRQFVDKKIDEVILNHIYACLEFMPLWQLINLKDYYFEEGLGALPQDSAVLYQQFGLIYIYYGDKSERLHCNFRTGQSYFMTYHQPIYDHSDIGYSVAEVVRDYINEPD